MTSAPRTLQGDPPSVLVRAAEDGDVEQLLALARGFATSFTVEPDAFRRAFAQVRAAADARLSVAARADDPSVVLGYLLGFVHATFYANGAVAWVEEVAVGEGARRGGVGTALMGDFEGWAAGRGARLVALATRRAADFYRALGYEESATYFRKRF